MIFTGFMSYYSSVFLAMEFNLLHGVGNNPDGVIFMPIAFGIIFITLLIDVLVIIKTIKSHTITVYEKVFIILFFIIVIIICVSFDKDGWRHFIEDFKLKYF